MTEYLKVRLFLALFLPLMAYLAVRVGTQDPAAPNLTGNPTRYKSFGNMLILPQYMLTLAVIGLLTKGGFFSAEDALNTGFGILLSLTAYYVCLLPALPFFRKYFRAQTCVILWLLPNFLYMYCINKVPVGKHPLLVIPAPAAAVKAACILWLAGFLTVMVWKIASHLLFRRQIMASSREVTDEEVLQLWQEEQLAARMDPLLSMKPVYSSAVNTPLAIGFLSTTILLVLPEKQYTKEDLSLIFRHEIVHIQRKDAANKLFLTFCTALCWFNPFMWKAMRACSEDIELSCDETVLYHADQNMRQNYARLILSTAGCERGFTTCLSASAQSLRYRLRKITMPAALRKGGLTLALLTFLLVMSVGRVALSYEQFSAADLFTGKIGTASPLIQSLAFSGAEGDAASTYQCADPDALNRYIQSIQLHRTTGYYDYPNEGQYLHLQYKNMVGDTFHLYLNDGSLLLGEFQRRSAMDAWYISQDIDWNYIESLLEPVSG